jgi:hypothetical protein
MKITEDLIFKLERMFDEHNKKIKEVFSDYWGEYLKKWKIKYFFGNNTHVAWQLFNPSKHILIRPRLEDFSLEPVNLLVPIEFAEKILVLGWLPK